jgi:NitT/TauT family transport system substrate-binding protein
MPRSKQKSRGWHSILTNGLHRQRAVPRRLQALAAGAVLLLAPASPGRAEGANLQHVTFLAHWSPQAQFAGYYMAKAKGIYVEHGLDVEILPSGPEVSPEKALAEGRADFITRFLAFALESREKEKLPLVNIAQVFQHSALMIIALKSSGIRKLQDLEGKTLYAWPDTQISALLKKHNLNVRIIPKEASNALFLEGGADATAAMWYNEYHLLYAAGIETNELQVFFSEQYELNFPEDGIYCLTNTLAQRPEVCRAFVAASMEGWRYALEHPDETLDIVTKRVREAHTGSNRAHQRWMLARIGDLIDAKRIRMGALSPKDYRTVVDELLKAGVITNAPCLEDFHVDLAKPH